MDRLGRVGCRLFRSLSVVLGTILHGVGNGPWEWVVALGFSGRRQECRRSQGWRAGALGRTLAGHKTGVFWTPTGVSAVPGLFGDFEDA